MRNLIYLCDGTWQSPKNDRKTNVWKTAVSVDIGDDQVLKYDPGVGTSWPRITGGLFGAGLVDNILEGYRWICEHYIPGDHIYLFGFSRGAYTARWIAGMIGTVGLAVQASHIKLAWDVMKRQNPVEMSAWWAAGRAERANVHFIGVWDTVGAHGVPIGMNRLFAPKFPDCILGQHVTHARHALAEDEQRRSFQPCLWVNPPDPRIVQMWFPGWHSDVGGGGTEGLSDITLRWMMREAMAAGLRLRPAWDHYLKPDPNAIPTPVRGLTAIAGLRPRVIPPNSLRYDEVGGGA